MEHRIHGRPIKPTYNLQTLTCVLIQVQKPNQNRY